MESTTNKVGEIDLIDNIKLLFFGYLAYILPVNQTEFESFLEEFVYFGNILSSPKLSYATPYKLV